MQKAVIYCRVSSDRQVKEGNGLSSQEKRCSIYATNQGYKVVKVFKEEGESGGLFDRPAMQELIKYLDKYEFEKFVIVFDDLKRFARDLQVHLKLKSELISRGATLKCPNFNFEDSPEGRLLENISASTSQYERETNRRQVIQKMKSRIDSGYWPFCYPPGLINKKDPNHGKILIPHEPYANIYKQAIENYRDGILNTLEQVQQFINLKYKEKGINKKPASISGSQRILTNILYAGWIEYKPWNVPLQKGKHTGFITKETYDAVQAKLFSKSKAALRKDYNEDFPLRGFIVCNTCQKPMTAAWHTGRNRKHAYYHCKQPGCPMQDKSVKKVSLEDQFSVLINELKPNKDVLNLIREVLLDTWLNRDQIEEENKKTFQGEIDKLENKKKQFMDRISSSTNELLIKEYEKELEKILIEKETLEKQLPLKVYSQDSFGTATKIVLKYLENPVTMWKSNNYKDKRLLLEMYFEKKLAYDLKEGLGTASLACLPKLLATKDSSKNHLVEMPGIEPGSEKTRI